MKYFHIQMNKTGGIKLFTSFSEEKDNIFPENTTMVHEQKEKKNTSILCFSNYFRGCKNHIKLNVFTIYKYVYWEKVPLVCKCVLEFMKAYISIKAETGCIIILINHRHFAFMFWGRNSRRRNFCFFFWL